MTYQWKTPFLLILILITLVNEWKAKWVHEGYSQFKKKHQNDQSGRQKVKKTQK